MHTGATFRLFRDDGGSAAGITRRLGLTPSTATEPGQRPAPRSRPASGASWQLSSTAPESGELAGHLTWLLDRLEPARVQLWQLTEEGYQADWFCLAASHATEHAVELDRTLLARLLRLPGDLLIDVMGDELD
jgi:hypothetical protein